MPTENYSPNWHVRCVSVPGPDTDMTLHVSFDNARYMFGCGEGTQRAYVQKKLGLRGIEAIFLSDTQNRTRMGLPGVIMTAADVGIPQLNVIGPPDMSHFISTFRSSVMRSDFKVIPKSMPIGKSPHDVTEMFHSSNITVTAVSLVPPALRTAPIVSDNPPIDISTFRPDFSTIRPATMLRPELVAWRDLIVSHMFTRSDGTDGRRDQAKAPFVRGDGTFAASWPELKYPLPLPTPEEQATELVYILEPPPIRGKFDVKQAAALGVPNGPIRGRLVKGENIEVDDPTVEGGKRIIRPEDCVSGGGPGPILIIVTCSPANLPSLLESSAFRRFQSSTVGTAVARKVHMMVHRVLLPVWRDPAYQAWVASFGTDTQHFLAEPETYSNDIYFRSAAAHMDDLALLDPKMFRKAYNDECRSFESDPTSSNCRVLLPNHQVRMHPPAPAELLPNHGKDKHNLEPNDKSLLSEKDPRFQSVRTKALDAIQAKQTALTKLQNQLGRSPAPGHDITVVTLGTGSAIPSKYRNVSATILSIPRLCDDQDGAILLDCGEGTLGQMRRRYGPLGMRQLYSELKMIFISHMHADHHLGLHSILEDRFKNGITSTLYILAPFQIGLHLQESASWQKLASDEALANIVFINSLRLSTSKMYSPRGGEKAVVKSSPTSSSTGSTSESTRAFLESIEAAPYSWGQEDIFSGGRRWPSQDCIGISEAINHNFNQSIIQLTIDLGLDWIHVPRVAHRGTANGLVIKHNSDWKIVYSGDTKPCETLVKAGMNATLLIHEATLEDDKAEMAVQKGHSTFSQAIKVGKDMKARHVLLNHFSQRYPKVPKLPMLMPDSPNRSPPGSPRSDRNGPIVSISFDLMSIQISDMWKMAHYMEPISLLFPEEEEAEGDDAEEVEMTEEAQANGGSGKKKKPEKKQVDRNGAENGQQQNGQAKTDAKKAGVAKGWEKKGMTKALESESKVFGETEQGAEAKQEVPEKAGPKSSPRVAFGLRNNKRKSPITSSPTPFPASNKKRQDSSLPSEEIPDIDSGSIAVSEAREQCEPMLVDESPEEMVEVVAAAESTTAEQNTIAVEGGGEATSTPKAASLRANIPPENLTSGLEDILDEQAEFWKRARYAPAPGDDEALAGGESGLTPSLNEVDMNEKPVPVGSEENKE